MAVLAALRVAVAVIYCLAGFAVFVTFLIINNYPTSVWGCFTAVCNGILIHLHVLKLRNTLQNWYDEAQLGCSGRFGFTFFALGTAGLTYHVVKEIMLKAPIMPVEGSEIIPAIWSFMTLKSGLILMYYATYYREAETEGESLVTSANEEDTA